MDFAIFRDFPFAVRVENVRELSSDHKPIFKTFNGGVSFTEARLRRTHDWERFATFFPPLSLGDIHDVAAGALTRCVAETMSVSIKTSVTEQISCRAAG